MMTNSNRVTSRSESTHRHSLRVRLSFIFYRETGRMSNARLTPASFGHTGEDFDRTVYNTRRRRFHGRNETPCADVNAGNESILGRGQTPRVDAAPLQELREMPFLSAQ